MELLEKCVVEHLQDFLVEILQELPMDFLEVPVELLDGGTPRGIFGGTSKGIPCETLENPWGNC